MKDNAFMKDVLENDVVEKLLEFVESSERDRFEAGVLGLSFLSEHDRHGYVPEVIARLNSKNALAVLIRHLADDKEDMKKAAAFCCRNLYLVNPPCQKYFLEQGGAHKLVLIFQNAKDSTTLFECVLNILELLLVFSNKDDEERVQVEIKMYLYSVGIMNIIEEVLEVLDI